MPVIKLDLSSSGPQIRDRKKSSGRPYGPETGSSSSGLLARILSLPCRLCSTLGPWDKLICGVCAFLILVNVPHVVLRDKTYRGTEGLGKMHGKIKETWNQVNISKSWGELDLLPSMPNITLPSMPDLPSMPNLPGLVGGANSTLGGGLAGVLGNLRGSDSDADAEAAKQQEDDGAASAPPTSPPTLAPTALKPEDPIAVAAQIAKQDLHVHLAGEWDVPKFPRPLDCAADVLERVKKSGMDGTGCSGQPYTQACSISVLTRGTVPSWLDGYVEELRDLRTGTMGEEATFVGAVLGALGGTLTKCDAVENEMRLAAPAQTSSDAAKAAVTHLLSKPKLFCHNPESNEVTKKWGLVDGAVDLANLDKHLQDAGVHEHVKDAVFIAGGESTVQAIAGGMVTLARTRYVEFDYDWKGAWGKADLKSIIDGLDTIGHTCYWAGNEKLWRVTGCWQEFYGYRSWSHLACSNRNLAPKLAGRMEKMFEATIGA